MPTSNLQRIWPLTSCNIPGRAIQVTLARTLAIEKCLPSNVINTTGNWLFSLVKCSCAKSIHVQYNWILGGKGFTCEVNCRNIELSLLTQYFAFAKSSHAHGLWLKPMNIFSCDSQQRRPHWTSNVLACESPRSTIQWSFAMNKPAHVKLFHILYTWPFPHTDTSLSKLIYVIYEWIFQVKIMHLWNDTTHSANRPQTN